MTKFLIILLISGLTSISSLAQSSNEQEDTAMATGEIGKVSAIPLNVLFATNEDCDLYINGQFKSTVSKAAHKYVKLTPGTYIYTAKSRTATGEFDEKFIVKEDRVNEVFIDLLYFLEQNNSSKSNLGNKQAAIS